MTPTSQLILLKLVHDRRYLSEVAAHLKSEYFEESWQRKAAAAILDLWRDSSIAATPDSIRVDAASSKSNFTKDEVAALESMLQNAPPVVEHDWLMQTTEQWCRDRAIYNALMESVEIINDGERGNRALIPNKLATAISVSFDTRVGHDYTTEPLERFRAYTAETKRLPYDIEIFNHITGGGMAAGEISIVMASTGVGKSMFMCHCAAAHLSMGYNVLYITLELSEYLVGKRIDANLLATPLDTLKTLSEREFMRLFQQRVNPVSGKLIIRSFPTSGASVIQFNSLIDSLKQRGFIPDVIYVDYLNICSSTRAKPGREQASTYLAAKYVAEELRAMAMERNVPVFTAVQSNRAGFRNSDVEVTEVGESWGIPQTADFMFALISLPELARNGHVMAKILKIRDGDDTKYSNKFLLGVDKSRATFFELDETINMSAGTQHDLSVIDALTH